MSLKYVPPTHDCGDDGWERDQSGLERMTTELWWSYDNAVWWINIKCDDQNVFVSLLDMFLLLRLFWRVSRFDTRRLFRLSHLRLISQLFTSLYALLRFPHAITLVSQSLLLPAPSVLAPQYRMLQKGIVVRGRIPPIWHNRAIFTKPLFPTRREARWRDADFAFRSQLHRSRNVNEKENSSWALVA